MTATLSRGVLSDQRDLLANAHELDGGRSPSASTWTPGSWAGPTAAPVNSSPSCCNRAARRGSSARFRSAAVAVSTRAPTSSTVISAAASTHSMVSSASISDHRARGPDRAGYGDRIHYFHRRLQPPGTASAPVRTAVFFKISQLHHVSKLREAPRCRLTLPETGRLLLLPRRGCIGPSQFK